MAVTLTMGCIRVSVSEDRFHLERYASFNAESLLPVTEFVGIRPQKSLGCMVQADVSFDLSSWFRLGSSVLFLCEVKSICPLLM